VGPALCGAAADLYGGPAGGLLAAAVLSALVVPMFMLHRRLAQHETDAVSGPDTPTGSSKRAAN